MTYEEKYNELVELSHSENSEIKEKADAWLIGIGLQGAAELKVSAFLLDLAIRNVKGEITRDEVSQRLKEHYGNTEYVEPKSELNGGYEIIPPDSTVNCALLYTQNLIRKRERSECEKFLL